VLRPIIYHLLTFGAVLLTACGSVTSSPTSVPMPTSTSLPADASLVHGEVVFDETAQSFSGATVTIRLEDVSRADAPAQIVAEQILPDVSHTAGSPTQLPFAIEGTIPDERARYAVRVHVDVDGDGQLGPGDYMNMESYPVLTYGNPNRVTVRVQEVR
jgi:uncharacterized lipoprotein YbaY